MNAKILYVYQIFSGSYNSCFRKYKLINSVHKLNSTLRRSACIGTHTSIFNNFMHIDSYLRFILFISNYFPMVNIEIKAKKSAAGSPDAPHSIN